MKKIRTAAVCMIVLLVSVEHLCAQPLRIMPLGNSITQAESTRLSYRYPLWEKLTDANVGVDFVGSLNTNFGGSPVYPNPNFDREHEGHWGWRADELLAGLPQWLGGYTPDIVLMHAGSNDAFQNNSTASTVQELRSIIDVIRADNPNVTILLAKLIGTTMSSNTAIIALNNQIDGIATEKNTSASRVIVVDQYSGFDPATDTYDGVHPDASGEEKMAQKWFDAIMQMQVPGGTGTGLRAEYFNNINLAAPVVLNRVDPQVNFDWGTGSPGSGINADNYSVRWTGQVESPVTGNVVFSTVSDDGVRLWVNDVQVINNWGVHAPTQDNSAPIALTAGVKYNIRMEFFENAIGAVARLLWSYTGQGQQAIPQGRLYPASGNGDVTAPSVPFGISSSSITQTSFTLSWNAATDAVGVTGYEVFRDGVSVGITASLSINMNTGLAPGVTYAMTVRAGDAAGNWSAQSVAHQVTTSGTPSGGTGTGLRGEYFNNLNLTAPVVLNRVDPQVNFDWGTGSPGSGINADNYSVRWTGQVESPVTGNVVFSTVSDDGVRLWVNDVQVINNWGVHGPTQDNSTPIALTAGVKYNIRMEFFENAIGAVARLLWSYTGQGQQAIPQSRLYPASGNGDVTAPSVPSGLASSAVTQTSFALSWNAATDAVGVTGYEVFRNGVSVGTTASLSMNINTGLAPGVTYTMTVRAGDAAGNWSAQSTAHQVTTSGTPGGGTGTGLRAEYFNNINLAAPVVLNRVDPQVNFDWGTGSPGSGVNADIYSVRWTGQVESPVTGNVVFSTVSDDGVRLWINDVQVITNWGVHAPIQNNSTPIALTAGARYNIRMEYFENAIGAVARLLWSYTGQSQQAIPQSRLYPAAESMTSARSFAGGDEPDLHFGELHQETLFDQAFSLYPNPVYQGDLHVRISSPGNTQYRVAIYAPDSRLFFDRCFHVVEGENHVVIPGAELPEGLSLVVICGENNVRFSGKVIVHK